MTRVCNFDTFQNRNSDILLFFTFFTLPFIRPYYYKMAKQIFTFRAWKKTTRRPTTPNLEFTWKTHSSLLLSFTSRPMGMRHDWEYFWVAESIPAASQTQKYILAHFQQATWRWWSIHFHGSFPCRKKCLLLLEKKQAKKKKRILACIYIYQNNSLAYCFSPIS